MPKQMVDVIDETRDDDYNEGLEEKIDFLSRVEKYMSFGPSLDVVLDATNENLDDRESKYVRLPNLVEKKVSFCAARKESSDSCLKAAEHNNNNSTEVSREGFYTKTVISRISRSINTPKNPSNLKSVEYNSGYSSDLNLQQSDVHLKATERNNKSNAEISQEKFYKAAEISRSSSIHLKGAEYDSDSSAEVFQERNSYRAYREAGDSGSCSFSEADEDFVKNKVVEAPVELSDFCMKIEQFKNTGPSRRLVQDIRKKVVEASVEFSGFCMKAEQFKNTGRSRSLVKDIGKTHMYSSLENVNGSLKHAIMRSVSTLDSPVKNNIEGSMDLIEALFGSTDLSTDSSDSSDGSQDEIINSLAQNVTGNYSHQGRDITRKINSPERLDILNQLQIEVSYDLLKFITSKDLDIALNFLKKKGNRTKKLTKNLQESFKSLCKDITAEADPPPKYAMEFLLDMGFFKEEKEKRRRLSLIIDQLDGFLENHCVVDTQTKKPVF